MNIRPSITPVVKHRGMGIEGKGGEEEGRMTCSYHNEEGWAMRENSGEGGGGGEAIGDDGGDDGPG